MKLKVWVPTEVLLVEEATNVKAEAENGWFCILPRHIDFVTSLVAGILMFERPGGETAYLAIDRGILVKCGSEVCVSTRNAASCGDLGSVRQTAEEHFRRTRESEQTARAFEAKLEADLVRQLLELEKYG